MKIVSAVSKHRAKCMCINVNEFSNMFGHCVLILRWKYAKNECWKEPLLGSTLEAFVFLILIGIRIGIGIGSNFVLFSWSWLPDSNLTGWHILGALQKIACTNLARFVVKLNEKKPPEDLVQICNPWCFEGLGIYWAHQTQAMAIDDGLGGGRMCARHAIVQLKVIQRAQDPSVLFHPQHLPEAD